MLDNLFTADPALLPLVRQALAPEALSTAAAWLDQLGAQADQELDPLAVTADYEASYRPRPLSMYALAAARHMHEYGTTREQLAEVALAARKWAQLIPTAFKPGDLTVDDVLSARTVSSPLAARDCCLVSDGRGAVVMTSAERAADLPTTPDYLLGGWEATWHRSISMMPDLTSTAAQESGRRAHETFGYGPGDMDVVEPYAAFTINPILFPEDPSFCAKGEGGDFVAHGRIVPGGALPANTNGRPVPLRHPGMYGNFLLIEAVRQLRGATGERQAADATSRWSPATAVRSPAR